MKREREEELAVEVTKRRQLDLLCQLKALPNKRQFPAFWKDMQGFTVGVGSNFGSSTELESFLMRDLYHLIHVFNQPNAVRRAMNLRISGRRIILKAMKPEKYDKWCYLYLYLPRPSPFIEGWEPLEKYLIQHPDERKQVDAWLDRLIEAKGSLVLPQLHDELRREALNKDLASLFIRWTSFTPTMA